MNIVFIFTSFRYSFPHKRQILDEKKKKVEGNSVPKTEITASKYSIAVETKIVHVSNIPWIVGHCSSFTWVKTYPLTW